MRMLSETYNLYITPLTPLHVGSGEEINPGEYFVFETDDGPVLYVIDMGYLAGKLAKGREKLVEWIESEPIGWVKRVHASTALTDMVKKYARFECDLTHRVAEAIEHRWGQPESRLGVRMLQRPGGHAIVPGSSIKGAIRTALLWNAARKPLRVPDDKRGRAVAEWERKALGGSSEKIEDDPLRHLKISDAPAPGVRTIVFDTQHVGMKTAAGQQAELQDYRECLPDTLGELPNYTIIARLQIESGHPHYRRERLKLSARGILDACRSFYMSAFKADAQYWEGDSEMAPILDEIRDRIAAEPESALVRLGWGCGMDAISLNLAKAQGKHPPRRIDPRFEYAPATRRLIDNVPPGWALIRLESA